MLGLCTDVFTNLYNNMHTFLVSGRICLYRVVAYTNFTVHPHSVFFLQVSVALPDDTLTCSAELKAVLKDAAVFKDAIHSAAVHALMALKQGGKYCISIQHKPYPPEGVH